MTELDAQEHQAGPNVPNDGEHGTSTSTDVVLVFAPRGEPVEGGGAEDPFADALRRPAPSR